MSEAQQSPRKEGGSSRDYSDYDPKKEGPPHLGKGESLPLAPDSGAPPALDEVLDAKKAKELKKKLEKEAKMKKFQEKQEQKKAAEKKPEGDKAKPKQEKVVKAKDKGPGIEEVLEVLKGIPAGERKPMEKLPDAYDPKFVEAVWYPWWVKQGYFKPEYGVDLVRF